MRDAVDFNGPLRIRDFYFQRGKGAPLSRSHSMGSFYSCQKLADVEREYILQVLAECEGNRTRASKLLGISLRGLRLKLHNYACAGFNVPPCAHGYSVDVPITPEPDLSLLTQTHAN
jgi:hypothetical protein